MKFPWLRVYSWLYLVFLFAPVFLLPLFAFNAGTVIAFPLQGFSLKWFAALLDNESLHEAVRNSLTIAITVSVVSTTLGIFAARAATRYDFRGKGPMIGLIMLPLVMPEVILAVALLVVFLQIALPLGMLAIILGHILVCTPFCIAILNGAFLSLDKSLEEAAYDLGETRISTFRLIILPLVMPGIISSLLIAFIISLDEFIMAFFVGGTTVTLPIYIFSQLRFPAGLPVIMALGTILVCLSILLLSIAEYVRRRGVARTGAKDTGGFL
ncbi:MAG: ABC transporter permease [Rhodobacteraceae bacterium]|nr:ABC transporter permease [Paracoccaceae bacterium]